MKRAVEEILKFNEERDWDQFHNPENLAKSISIEAGELLECFQWNNEYDKQHVCEELADVMNYCILMANKLKPIAALAKMAGKILPPRHPKAKMRLVKTVLPSPIKSK